MSDCSAKLALTSAAVVIVLEHYCLKDGGEFAISIILFVVPCFTGRRMFQKKRTTPRRLAPYRRDSSGSETASRQCSAYGRYAYRAGASPGPQSQTLSDILNTCNRTLSFGNCDKCTTFTSTSRKVT